MLICGFHAVSSRLRRHAGSIRELYVQAGRQDARMRTLLALALAQGVHARAVETARLDALAGQRRHQGVVALAEPIALAGDLRGLLDALGAPPLLLLLDGVTDPRNLGACLRAADGAGVHAVIAPKDRACALTDVAVQTASGAADSVPYLMVTNLARTIDELRERDIWVLGTTDDASRDLFEVDIPAAVAWVLGAEGTGLRRLTRERCDELVRIPMMGAVASLNVAVAAGVVLYQSVRARRVR
ncbi:MAG: 23S rRNA (guanosine(2251)-2'-O)-methyltransferase RlmB [Burkholderiales bacterium]|nr:MAG: 23S rRNA (guanosine(2251)-2'-O)-methyltransferase RlmB [Burkholderiales bacterium]